MDAQLGAVLNPARAATGLIAANGILIPFYTGWRRNRFPPNIGTLTAVETFPS